MRLIVVWECATKSSRERWARTNRWLNIRLKRGAMGEFARSEWVWARQKTRERERKQSAEVAGRRMSRSSRRTTVLCLPAPLRQCENLTTRAVYAVQYSTAYIVRRQMPVRHILPHAPRRTPCRVMHFITSWSYRIPRGSPQLYTTIRAWWAGRMYRKHPAVIAPSGPAQAGRAGGAAAAAAAAASIRPLSIFACVRLGTTMSKRSCSWSVIDI